MKKCEDPDPHKVSGLIFFNQMYFRYGYYNDGSGWEARPPWQSYQLLFRAQARKTPWMAAWDRVSRLLYRWVWDHLHSSHHATDLGIMQSFGLAWIGFLTPHSFSLLFRYEQRGGEIQADSPVEDIFDEYSNGGSCLWDNPPKVSTPGHNDL